jgi:hypothetical protein
MSRRHRPHTFWLDRSGTRRGRSHERLRIPRVGKQDRQPGTGKKEKVNMVKMTIGENEEYPVYSLDKPDNEDALIVEVTPEFVAEYEEVENRYNAMQSRLIELSETAWKNYKQRQKAAKKEKGERK